MKRDLTELKKITFDLMEKNGDSEILQSAQSTIFNKTKDDGIILNPIQEPRTIDVEESLSLFEQEKEIN